MVFEDVKRLLSEYKGYKKQLNSEQLRVQELREKLPNLKAVNYGKVRVSCGNNQNEFSFMCLIEYKILQIF